LVRRIASFRSRPCRAISSRSLAALVWTGTEASKSYPLLEHKEPAFLRGRFGWIKHFAHSVAGRSARGHVFQCGMAPSKWEFDPARRLSHWRLSICIIRGSKMQNYQKTSRLSPVCQGLGAGKQLWSSQEFESDRSEQGICGLGRAQRRLQP